MISIVIDDQVSARLKAFGDSAPKLLDRTLSRTGNEYRTYVRKNYLSGQYLGRRSGRLQRDMRVGRVRGQKHVYMVSGSPRLSSIYEHGAVIAPKEAGGVLRFMVASAYVVRWVFTRKPVLLRARPFITASSRAFPFQPTFARVAEQEIEKATKQQGLT